MARYNLSDKSAEELDKRRRVVAWLRHCADRQEEVAAELRARADEMDPDLQPTPDAFAPKDGA